MTRREAEALRNEVELLKIIKFHLKKVRESLPVKDRPTVTPEIAYVTVTLKRKFNRLMELHNSGHDLD